MWFIIFLQILLAKVIPIITKTIFNFDEITVTQELHKYRL